jgi:hypothetical protein
MSIAITDNERPASWYVDIHTIHMMVVGNPDPGVNGKPKFVTIGGHDRLLLSARSRLAWIDSYIHENAGIALDAACSKTSKRNPTI